MVIDTGYIVHRNDETVRKWMCINRATIQKDDGSLERVFPRIFNYRDHRSSLLTVHTAALNAKTNCLLFEFLKSTNKFQNSRHYAAHYGNLTRFKSGKSEKNKNKKIHKQKPHTISQDNYKTLTFTHAIVVCLHLKIHK